jgi:DNA repair exonuclease SbcCD ATPase subunit
MSWEDHRHSEIDDLENEVYALRSNVDDLKRMNTDVQYEAHAATENLSELEEANRELSEELAEISRAVKSLYSRIGSLERFARRSGAADVEELDNVDAELKKLASVAEHGRHARSRLLGDYESQRLQSAVASHVAARRQRDEQREEVLSLSKDLATTQITEPAHIHAIEEFGAAASRLTDATAKTAMLAEEAGDAQAKLYEDDAMRAAAAPKIKRGNQARISLYRRLDERISAAFKRGAVMPTWFDTALGPAPPAERTQEWMDAAVEVLAFRLTYDITHPVVALGIPPSAEQPQHRRDWYQDLGRRLAQLRV